jgi:predicted transcriptional regulator of viral defense system
MLADAPVGEHHTLVETARRVPPGVVCLLSALRFHHLTSQNPIRVWIAVDRKARRPAVDYPALHIVRYSAAALKEGIERHSLEGLSVPVYSAAKTVADCFKYRHKIGLDVVLEALRNYVRKGLSIPDLMRYGALCRVSRVMQPYLESLLA